VSHAHDLVGVGVGPFNLALAALLEPVGGVDAVFFEQVREFAWHPGLLLEGSTTQVPFLADLVTLADPTSRHSFLAYLAAHDRLYRFYFREELHVPRREYDHYCRWVAGRLASCRFGRRVERVRWLDGPGLFEVEVAAPSGCAAGTSCSAWAAGPTCRPPSPPRWARTCCTPRGSSTTASTCGAPTPSWWWAPGRAAPRSSSSCSASSRWPATASTG